MASKKKIKQTILFGSGFLVFISFFLLFNSLLYNDFLSPYIDANKVIGQVLGCNYYFFQPWYFYLMKLPLNNIFYLALIQWTFFILKKYSKKCFSYFPFFL
ncbi:hypothetical protein GF327_06165 [Candidatus Woesearchaeota archaeon]|nr:hypothetical protein [Candidatus Woesearchaeota archaeon]